MTLLRRDNMLAVGKKCMCDAIFPCLCNYFASTAVDPDVNVKRVQAVRIGVLIVMSALWVGCTYYGLARLHFGRREEHLLLIPLVTVAPIVETPSELSTLVTGRPLPAAGAPLTHG